MLSFENDYSHGAHPKVMDALVASNLEPLSGYGSDPYTQRAAQKIALACGAPEARVYLLTGGTQTNQLVIDTMLAPYEAVVSVDSGHINVHEAGAVEYTGHKVLSIEQRIDRPGVMAPEALEAYLANFFADANNEHMARPGMVYLSFPSEYGTLYSLGELQEIRALCDRYGLRLYIDGARLGYALASPSCDVTLEQLASLADAFYIGGTKVGAIAGEALVFPKANEPAHFVTQIKQHGALLAQGRLLGVQFDALFTDGLYFEIGRHAIEMAGKLKSLLLAKGYELYLDSPTNQQFVVMSNERLAKLREHARVSFWEAVDAERTVIRLATSWATTPEDLDELAHWL